MKKKELVVTDIIDQRHSTFPRLSPQINFPWSEINRISCQNNNFIVKLTDKKSPKFVVGTNSIKLVILIFTPV